MSGVTRSFGRKVVLSGLDLSAAKGEVLGLIGPNGGGKSTVLTLLAGLARPTAGSVLVDGMPAHEVAVRRTGTVGLLTADPGLYPLLTGEENLAFFGGLLGLGAAEVRRRAGPLLEELGLQADVGRPTGAWSSGMRQKLSFVRASLLEPSLLLLDEPTANLDPVSASTLWRLVRQEAGRGRCVVLVTHDLVAAEALCDRVAILAGNVRHVHHLGGERSAPPPGALLRLYAEHVGER